MALEIRSGIAKNLHDGFRHAFKYSKLPGSPAPFAADRKPHFLLAAGSALCPFPSAQRRRAVGRRYRRSGRHKRLASPAPAARAMSAGGCRAGREVVGTDLRGQSLQLEHGRGPADVGADQQYALALPLDQPTSQFGCRRRLAGALKTGQQHDDRGLGPQVFTREKGEGPDFTALMNANRFCSVPSA